MLEITALSPQLLEILVCPVSACRGRLELRPAGAASGSPSDAGGASSRESGGRLACVRCGRVYRIEESWPVLIPEEADPSSAASA